MISTRQIFSLIVALLSIYSLSGSVYSVTTYDYYFPSAANPAQTGTLNINSMQDIYDNCDISVYVCTYGQDSYRCYEESSYSLEHTYHIPVADRYDKIVVDCTRDSAGNVWNNIYFNSLSLPTQFCRKKYIGGTPSGTACPCETSKCRIYDGFNLYFEASNNFIAASGVSLTNALDYGGRGPNINIKAKNIDVSGSFSADGAECDHEDYCQFESDRGGSGGTITLYASENLDVTSISSDGGEGTDGGTDGGRGGKINISAVNIDVDSISINAGDGYDSGSSGGSLYVYSKDLDVGTIDAYASNGKSCGDGGHISIKSDDVSAGNINIRGCSAWESSGGDGGSLDIVSADDVVLSNIYGIGGSGDYSGGEAGSVRIVSDSLSCGTITVYGGSGSEGDGGIGGTIKIDSGLISSIGSINAYAGLSNEGGIGSDGGYVEINTDNNLNVPAINAYGSRGSNAWDRSHEHPGEQGGEGGTIILRSDENITVFGNLNANAGNGGSGNYDRGGGPGGIGGDIKIKATKVTIQSNLYANGGNGGGSSKSYLSPGRGNTGGDIRISADILDVGSGYGIYANGGASGSPAGCGSNGGRGGKISIFVSDPDLSDNLECAMSVKGGTGGCCSSYSGGTGGKVVFFSDDADVYDINSLDIDVSGGAADVTCCEDCTVGNMGSVGTKTLDTRIVTSGFRMFTKIIDNSINDNLYGSIRVRIVDPNTGNYIPSLLGGIWTETRQISDGKIPTGAPQFFGVSNLEYASDLELVLGKTYLLEVKISEDNPFNEDNCNNGNSDCDIYYRELEYYYGI